MSLKTRVIQSGFWFALATATTNLSSFLVTLILARLLTPEDFGLIAIASFTISAASILQNMGLSQALIYRTSRLERAADTAFFLAIGLGIIAFLIAILCAPLVSVIFKEPRAILIVQTLSISLIISSFGIVPETIMIARLDFKRKFIADTVPTLGYALIVIGLAGTGIGVWSIIIGKIIESTSRVRLNWYLAHWQPQFQFEWSEAKEILNYGKDVAISSTLAIFFLNIDNAFISRMLGTSQLGYYTFAFSLATLPVLLAQRVIDTVSFPAYTQLKEQKDTLSKAYLKSLRIVTSFVLPMNLGLLAVAPVLVPVLYGEKWRPSIVLIQVLALYGLTRAIANVPTTVLLAIGKQHLFPRFNLFYLTLVILLLTPAIHLGGTIGAATIMTLVIWAGAMTWLFFVNHYLDISFKQIIQTIAAQGVASTLMVVIVQVTTYWVDESPYALALLVAIGITTYAGILLVFTRGKVVNDVKEIIQPLVRRKYG